MSGELIALVVAVSWTVTALFSETASKRIGALAANVLRMSLSLILLSLFLLVTTGSPYPTYTDRDTWLWLAASGLVGYAFGDTCLFNSYILIGSRFGQLLMTLSGVFAALSGYVLLGETLSWRVLLAMTITLSGIGLSIMGKEDTGSHGSAPSHTGSDLRVKLPIKGILLGIGAAFGQGVGLVLSKQGMLAYNASICNNANIADNAPLLTVAPFAGTFIRAIFGLATFFLMAVIQRKTGNIRKAFHDAKGLRAIGIATIFGPFIGVSLSLMAVEYTSSGVAQTIMALTPVLILIPARIFYHKKITPKEVLGAIISVVGVSLFF